MPVQEFGYRQCVRAASLRPQGQCLQPLEHQEGIERRCGCAYVSKTVHTHPAGKGGISEHFLVYQAVIAFRRSCQKRILLRGPVEISAIDHYSAKSCPVTANPFCGRMYGHVRTPAERLEKIASAAESIVHHHADTLSACHLHYRFEIRDIEGRISENLQIYGFSTVVHKFLQILHTITFCKTHLYAHVPESDLEHGEGTAIEERRCHYIVSRTADVRHGQEYRGSPGRRGHCSHTAFEGSHSLFENIVRCIRDSGIDVPFFFQGEKISPLLHILEYVCRSLVNGHGSGLGYRVDLLTGPQLQCLETVFSVFHDFLKIPKFLTR